MASHKNACGVVNRSQAILGASTALSDVLLLAGIACLCYFLSLVQ